METTRQMRSEQWAENQGVIIVNTWGNTWAMINCGSEPTIMCYGNRPWVEDQAKKRGYEVHSLEKEIELKEVVS